MAEAIGMGVAGRRAERPALPGEKPPSGTTAPATGPVRLSELSNGATARLHRRELSDNDACLLAAMGMTVGCRLVVRSNGNPYIVEVRSTRIGLARSVAEQLLVLAEPGIEE